MLEAAPKRWWSSGYVLRDGDRPVGEIGFAAIREAGTLVLGEVRYTIARGGVRGPFRLEDAGGELVAQARRPSAFRRRFEVEQGGTALRLEPASRWNGTYTILGADHSPLGTVRRRSAFSRQLQVDLPESLPLELRGFVLWLFLLLIRRDEAAASAS